MTETHQQSADPWNALPAEGRRYYLDRHKAVAARLIAKLEANYGTRVEYRRTHARGTSVIVYRARIGRYGKAFTMDALESAAEQAAFLDLHLGSLQAAAELRTLLDSHGTINPEEKAGLRP